MYAIIYKNGEDDYTMWQPDLPKDVEAKIEAILAEYLDSGCSVRGNKNEIMEDM